MALLFLGKKTRNRQQSHLVFESGEEGTQRGSNGDEKSSSPPEDFRFEFWKAGMGAETLGCQLYLQGSCHDR